MIGELRPTLASLGVGHVILDDDLCHFDGSHDHWHLDTFLSLIRAGSRYQDGFTAAVLQLSPTPSVVAQSSPL